MVSQMTFLFTLALDAFCFLKIGTSFGSLFSRFQMEQHHPFALSTIFFLIFCNNKPSSMLCYKMVLFFQGLSKFGTEIY